MPRQISKIGVLFSKTFSSKTGMIHRLWRFFMPLSKAPTPGKISLSALPFRNRRNN